MHGKGSDFRLGCRTSGRSDSLQRDLQFERGCAKPRSESVTAAGVGREKSACVSPQDGASPYTHEATPVRASIQQRAKQSGSSGSGVSHGALCIVQALGGHESIFLCFGLSQVA